MKYLFILLFSLLTLKSFTQQNFEQAYFLDNDGKKTECFIKNTGWVKNPVSFDFKLKETDAPATLDINAVREFALYNGPKFIRADVQIDRSNTILRPINYIKEPEWSNERVFLKVIVDGKAKLYYFQDGYLTRFFFSTDQAPVQQLIYKEFLMSRDQAATVNGADLSYRGEVVFENQTFKQQLMGYMNYGESTDDDLKYTKYEERSLIKFFNSYYQKTGETYSQYKNVRKDIFNIRITPGVTYSYVNIRYARYSGKWLLEERNYKYGSNTNLRLGVDLEMPFLQNKWGFVIEPTYQSFKDKTGNVDLKFIDLPVGFRYYMYLNKDTKFHINGFLIPGKYVNLDSKLYSLKIQTGFNLSIGAGFGFRKYSGEIRYYTSKDLVTEMPDYYTTYPKVSLILGYQLF